MKTFYGWWVLAALFLVYAASNGIGLNTLPLFYEPLKQQFGWTHEQVTRPATLMYLLISVVAPFIGILLDRYKTKLIMLLGGLGLVASLFFYSSIHSLGQLTLVYVGYAVSLSLAGIVSSMYLISKWFVRYRGLAIGIFLMASSAGGAIFPPLAGKFIAGEGWQTAAQVLALAAAAMIIAPVVVLIKNRPEELGLRPDGLSTKPHQNTSAPPATDYTLKQALASPAFYLLLFVTASMWFCITGVVNHQSLYFADLNIGIEDAGKISGVFFTCSIAGKLLFGWLSDRFDKKNIMLLAAANLALGSALLLWLKADAVALVYLYAVVYGIGFSGAFTMIQAVVAELYHGKSYGKILGVVTGVDTFAGSMGILVLGTMRTKLATYLPSFQLMLGLCLLSCLCVFLLKTLTRPHATAPR